MEWSAGYFNSVQPGDVTYSFNPERRASKYSTNDFFAGVIYTIDLTQPAGTRITNLAFADGTPVTDETEIRIGMNSYRMGHLTKKGGVLEGESFPVLFDTEAEYGEEAGTIRNMTIKFLKEEKNGQYEGKPQQRWELSGLESRYNEQREIVKSLINDETISIPTSDDGRYTNIASINVTELMFKSDEAKQTAITTREKKLAQATEQESKQIKREITLIKALN